jgi:Uma2 family endonuclease
VEVVSPNDLYTGVEEKVDDWLRAGTRMVVVVNPQGRTVTVRLSQTAIKVLSEGDILDDGNMVPGWRLPVADILR